MALRDLETTQMAEVTRRWTTDPLSGLIRGLPVVGAYYPVLEEAHNGLTLRPQSGPSQRASEIRKRQLEMDQRHDPLLRGSFFLLSGLAELTTSEGQRIEYLHLRDVLHPFGLSGTQKTLREESGAALLVERTLLQEPRLQEVLQEIPLPKQMSTTTLLDAVRERIDLGKKIGLLEDEREAVLKEESAASADDPSANEARLTWIDVVTTFTRLLKSAKVSEKDSETLLAPLQEAEATAEKRKKPTEPALKPAQP